ncbi:MAG: RES family NAD+ phosphorylase [bacterium]|nr:RES family NAD+ phosphorylase [bacterium]
MAQAPTRSLAAIGYRNQTPGYEVRSGEGARRFGGRFNQPDSFPVLYLCTTRKCASAELKRKAYRQGLMPGGRYSYVRPDGVAVVPLAVLGP